MNKTTRLNNILGVVAKGQTYLNTIYLLLAFPLGTFYFVLLVAGLSADFSLTIIWIGIPILLLMLAAMWALSAFEREMAIKILHVDIKPMSRKTPSKKGAWEMLKAHLNNPVTWKGLVYLFAKFPLGILSFVVSISLIALTVALITAPFTYQSTPIELGFYQVDTLTKALISSILGLGVGIASMHVMNSLALVSGHFASLMLGNTQNGGDQ